MTTVLKATDNDIVLRIMADDGGLAPSPREDDNLGTMVCFHKRYELGDKGEHRSEDFGGWSALEQHLIGEHDAAAILPLYLYDHSGLRMKVGSFQGLLPQGHAEFDSGQVGFIYCSRAKMREEYGITRVGKEMVEKVRRMLEGEVTVYDQYLTGDVYGFSLDRVIKCESCGHESEEHIDSCWGFYGHDWKENGMLGHFDGKYEYLFDRLEEV